jgi:predicted nucleic acid-binding protein
VWVGSVVLEAELSRNPDSDRRTDAQELLTFVKQVIKLDDNIVLRARDLQTRGFAEFDALHLACAETGQVHIFLTTDDRLIGAASVEPVGHSGSEPGILLGGAEECKPAK